MAQGRGQGQYRCPWTLIGKCTWERIREEGGGQKDNVERGNGCTHSRKGQHGSEYGFIRPAESMRGNER